MPARLAQLERSLSVYRGLVEVSTLINSITDFDELLGAILEVAQRVMSAEASSLFLLNDDGNLELAVARRADAASAMPRPIIVPRGQGIAGWVLAQKQALLVPDAYADPRFYREADRESGFHTRSILCAPLRRDGQEIGVLQVLNPRAKTAFEAEDLEPFTAYATLAATAIDKLRALERLRAQQRLEQELSFAREVQTSFLPQTLPTVPCLSFAAHYSPAQNIGGDFYDVQQVGPDELYFALGDVSGKGIPAALLMARVVSTLRLILRPGLAPAEILRQGNRMLHASQVHGMFITAIVGRIVPSQGRVEMASAGDHAPERVGTSPLVDFGASPPLGVLPEIAPPPLECSLRAGEALVFYTDGLIESLNSQREALGLRKVQETLATSAAAPALIVENLAAREAAHRGLAEPHDDLTILALGRP